VNKYLIKLAKRGRGTATIATMAGGAVLGAIGGRVHAGPKLRSETTSEYKSRRNAETIGQAATIGIGAGLIRRSFLQGQKAYAKGIRLVDSTMRRAGHRTAFAESKAFGRYSKPPYRRLYHMNQSAGPSPFARSSSTADLSKFGIKPGTFKTKTEARKHFKTHLHRVHPDRNKASDSTAKFQDLSTARDRLEKSDWFNKLANKNTYLNKIANQIIEDNKQAMKTAVNGKFFTRMKMRGC
jgi:hypothetical protein